jgi:hypothetical protein
VLKATAQELESILETLDNAVAMRGIACVANRSGTSLELHHGVVDPEPDIFIEQLINQTERATYTINL